MDWVRKVATNFGGPYFATDSDEEDEEEGVGGKPDSGDKSATSNAAGGAAATSSSSDAPLASSADSSEVAQATGKTGGPPTSSVDRHPFSGVNVDVAGAWSSAVQLVKRGSDYVSDRGSQIMEVRRSALKRLC
eukprot:GHVU01110056.1.p1 GENE.GHVU01110056.1~~GHVU01110056.1.p1  ORF type:complete len:133 (+),score=21.61 GHVU01110056.1:343-741(+)